jgi:hypothetical protein
MTMKIRMMILIREKMRVPKRNPKEIQLMRNRNSINTVCLKLMPSKIFNKKKMNNSIWRSI